MMEQSASPDRGVFMALDLSTITPPSAPQTSGRSSAFLRLVVFPLVALATLAVAVLSWQRGSSIARLWETQPKALITLAVQDAPLSVVVVETGTIESASNTTVKCQVEALVGMVGGTTGGTGRSGAQSGGGSGGSGGSGASGGSASAAPAPMTMTASTSKSASATASAAKKAAKKASSKSGSSSSGASGGGADSGGMSGGSRGGGGGGAGGGGQSGAGGTSGSGTSGGTTKSSGSSSSAASSTSETTITQRPTIRSFTYAVTPYVSLQPKRSAVAATPKSAGQGGGGGGGNRGGGGGGGGGGGNGEKPGSTRIIMIKTEGDSVEAGDVVCELDSAAFRDAVLAQQIKTDSARSAMIQAQSILEVNQIALREYRDGIYPQDLQLIRQYLSTCRAEKDRANRNLTWSQETLDKGFRAPQQHQADVLSLQRADIALVVAELMEFRLLNATGPKTIKALEAKLQANRADALALEAAYGTEADRLKRLSKMVENCTLRAPHAGTVVYSLPPSNGWRPATATIMEGATVREGQPIFELPDPSHMRLRAKINESKVGSIRPGQRASIRVDAFPDRTLLGTVGEVTLIPAPGSGPGSDIRIYFANINIDTGGFEGLKPGLSAEVTFLVDDRASITQVPIKAIRWVGDTAFAAVTTSPDRASYRWQPVELGLMNSTYAEIKRGLKVGDQIVAQPEALPAPKLDDPVATPPAIQVAGPAPATPRS